MKIPRYWAKGDYTGRDRRGKPLTTWAWGWSFHSLQEAQRRASERAARVFERVFSGGERLRQYDYLDYPLREEIVETLGSEDEPFAVVTRNRYGALVLNAARVCFADIDFAAPRNMGFGEWLAQAFSRKRREERAAAVEQAALNAIDAWAKANSRRSVRVYRTSAGFRLLFTDALYDPASRETDRLLEEIGSDPLYRKLTRKQESFRARLTPKPWRIGHSVPPAPYPRPDSAAEARHRDWLRRYEERSRGCAVCRLVKEYGAAPGDANVRRIVEYHDRCVSPDPAVRLA